MTLKFSAQALQFTFGQVGSVVRGLEVITLVHYLIMLLLDVIMLSLNHLGLVGLKNIH